MAVETLDLTNPDNFDDGFPHAYFKHLRAHAPISFAPEPAGVNRVLGTDGPGPGFWVITRHADVIHISKRPKLFSSYDGTNIPTLPPDQLARLRTIMLNMDPPQHVKYRSLVRRGFTPRMISGMEPHMREASRAIVDQIARKGECDFVTQVAAELPLIAICELMGVPVEDRHIIFDLSNRLIGFDDPEFQTSPEDAERASMEMWAYANSLGQKRRANPMQDLVTDLLQGEIDGDSLSELEFNNFFLLLAVAGNETTRNAISGGLLALMEHRDQWDRLRRNPALIDTAVDEIVRWGPPVMYFRRTATEDTEVSGTPIQAGDKLTLWYPSANRDEAVFPDGEVFDVGRRPNPHLGFGIGEHFCLGSHLAKLEIKSIFLELLARLPDIELAGEPRRLHSNFIGGIKELPVSFTPE